MIGERWKDLPAATLDEKAEHTAWAVKTALGYWQLEASSLNSRILLRYYALLQITAIFTFASQNGEIDGELRAIEFVPTGFVL